MNEKGRERWEAYRKREREGVSERLIEKEGEREGEIDRERSIDKAIIGKFSNKFLLAIWPKRY